MFEQNLILLLLPFLENHIFVEFFYVCFRDKILLN
jgi:hypothetical protein